MLARTVKGSVGLDGPVDASKMVSVAATGLVISDNVLFEAPQCLHVEVGLLQRPGAGLAHRGERGGQDVVERLAGRELFAEQRRAAAQLVVGERGRLRLEVVHLVDDLAEPPDLRLVAVDEAEQLGEGAQLATAR